MNDFVSLDYQSRVPIYEQIIKEVERYVALGILKPNEHIPSIRELASSLAINPNTVSKAYSELEKKGVIYTISTKGNFISDNIKEIKKKQFDEGLKNINSIISNLEKVGFTKEEIIGNIK